eukprot:SAG31_NODE_1784_length_7279_cov_2.932869_3_plen_562_part_00
MAGSHTQAGLPVSMLCACFEAPSRSQLTPDVLSHRRPLGLGLGVTTAAVPSFLAEFACIPGLTRRLGPKAEALSAAWPPLAAYLANETFSSAVAGLLGRQQHALSVLGNCADGLLRGSKAGSCGDKILSDVVQSAQRLLGLGDGQAALPKKGGSKTYHPILGWISSGLLDAAAAGGKSTDDVYSNQQEQIRTLWRAKTIRRLFSLPPAGASTAAPKVEEPEPEQVASKGFGGFFGRKAVGVGGANVSLSDSGSAAAFRRSQVLSAAELFNRLHTAMPVLRIEMLAALCFAIPSTSLVTMLWSELQADGGNTQHRLLGLAHKSTNPGAGSPLAQDPARPLLQLFLRCAICTYNIIDDSEVHERQFPLSLTELPRLAGFCNQLAFALHWNAASAVDSTASDEPDMIRPLVTKLLALLHERDARRSFTNPQTWAVADKKLAAELDKEVMAETTRAQAVMTNIPHVLSFERRALLFRQWVELERTTSAAVRTDIRVRRTHVVEDTLSVLGTATPAVLKGRWRIQFVNEQGLDEAGIDENGAIFEITEALLCLVLVFSCSVFMTVC